MAVKTTIDFDISQIEPGLTKRELARACGFSVGAKGRFKPEVLEVIASAEQKGYVFDNPVANKVKSTSGIKQTDLDLLELREWMLTKSYDIPEKGRISQAIIDEYVTEVPNFKRREAVSKPARVKGEKSETITLPPLPDYDATAARKWAIDNNLEGVPSRGRLPRWIAERFIRAHADAGTELPKAEPTNENLYAPEAPKVNAALWWEAIDLDGKTKIRKSYRDVDANGPYSIGWTPQPVYAWSTIDTDRMLELTPVS